MLAAAGDPAAQYKLAALAAQQGQAEQADRWLKQAAANDHPDALFTLATRYLIGSSTVETAVKLLERAAESGGGAATRMLASLGAMGLYEPFPWAVAVEKVATLAKHGDRPALRDLAGLCLLSNSTTDLAVPLINASHDADPVAAAVSACLAIEGVNGLDLDRMRASLALLAKAGYPNFDALSAAETVHAPSDINNEIDWDSVVEIATNALEARPVEKATVCDAPKIDLMKRAFNAPLCEYIIARSAPLLAPSTLIDPRDGQSKEDPYRSSLTATIGPADHDLTMIAFNHRIAQLAGEPYSTGEFLSVLQYRQGEEYRPHFDWLGAGGDLDLHGQRTRTALVYLNDGYEGGETEFLTPGLSIKGQRGDLLTFANVDESGGHDMTSRHAGTPITRGTKWLASKWYRERAYRF